MNRNEKTGKSDPRPASGSQRHALRHLAPLRTIDLNHVGMSLEERADVFSSIWGRFYALDFPCPNRFVGIGRAFEVGDTLAGNANLGDVAVRFDPKASHYETNQFLLHLCQFGGWEGPDEGSRPALDGSV